MRNVNCRMSSRFIPHFFQCLLLCTNLSYQQNFHLTLAYTYERSKHWTKISYVGRIICVRSPHLTGRMAWALQMVHSRRYPWICSCQYGAREGR
ncbi:hypothetical protein K443DRAFT_676118 [Laccaria amethystina LaAM-08-1]|uniref:Uncharacterized protein n=1 Tax=Laccaria amethystina LaAM-08-1 TaxID=1095629 RepID=A0A0C9WWT4_9AGAR|nr:hypothetical protein K443DRAFT_676118 [Laccaria amethystina LaAM-08-1]